MALPRPKHERILRNGYSVQSVAVWAERSTVQLVVAPPAVTTTAALLVPLKVMDTFVVNGGSAPMVVVLATVITPAFGNRSGPVDACGSTRPEMFVEIVLATAVVVVPLPIVPARWPSVVPLSVRVPVSRPL